MFLQYNCLPEVAVKPNKNIMVVTVHWLDTNKCFFFCWDLTRSPLCSAPIRCIVSRIGCDRCHVSTMGKNLDLNVSIL